MSQLERAVEIMDRLRSPGGCPWDAEQTHASLAPYLLEETYERSRRSRPTIAALLREELGDLLLQVLFHARLAEELPPEQAFGIDDVAGRPGRQADPPAPARVRRRRSRATPSALERDLGAAEDRREGPHLGHRRGAARPAGAGAGRQAGRRAPGGPGSPVAAAGRRPGSASGCSRGRARRWPPASTRRPRCARPHAAYRDAMQAADGRAVPLPT